MSKPLITIGPDETVWELSELMKTKNIHKVPVIENDNLIGIVTNTDLVSLASLGSDSEMRSICDNIFSRIKN
jgi:predicted transcriptional regulator